MLRDTDLSDLVRLRHSAQHADHLCLDGSEWGRHTALISLDGVCEYAMLLTAGHVGLDNGPKASFHNTLNALATELGSGWSPPDRRSLLDLHAARNRAQHGGTLPDAASLPRWRDATGVFVRSLVSACYRVELDDVLLADAIIDPPLREEMAAAEAASADAEYANAFEHAVQLLAGGRRRWREQQFDAYGHLPISEPFYAVPDLLDGQDRATDYADVAVFADSIGEYHWLLATRRQAADGVAVTEDDARRAMLFSYHWILRWQHFDADYPRDRWRAAYNEMAPPVTRDAAGNQEPPRIVAMSAAEIIELGGGRWRGVDVTVANLPERGRDSWGVDMTRALADAALSSGLTASRNANYGDVIAGERRHISGQFRFLLRPGITAETTVELLQATIDRATAQHQERQRSAEKLQAHLDDLAADITPAFALDSIGLFGRPQARAQVGEDGETFHIAVNVKGSWSELAHVTQAFRGVGGSLAGTMHEGSAVVFPVTGDPRRQRDEIARALQSCVALVQRLRAEAAEDQRLEQAFSAALQAAWERGTRKAPRPWTRPPSSES